MREYLKDGASTSVKNLRTRGGHAHAPEQPDFSWAEWSTLPTLPLLPTLPHVISDIHSLEMPPMTVFDKWQKWQKWQSWQSCGIQLTLKRGCIRSNYFMVFCHPSFRTTNIVICMKCRDKGRRGLRVEGIVGFAGS